MNEKYDFSKEFKAHWKRKVLREKKRKELEIRREFSVILLSDGTIV